MEPTDVQVPKRRVKFGPAPNQNIPHEWAEEILTKWAETDPAGFGRYLQYAALGALPPPLTNGRGRRAKGEGE